MRQNRRPALDALRGAALVSMTAYHACWDLVWLFGRDWAWYRGFGAYVWQQSICWTFLLLSGFCWPLGRRRLRRGLIVFAAGALVSAATLLALPENRVFCGVLTLLGTMSLALIPLEPLLLRLPARAGVAGSFCLFLLLRDVNQGRLGFEGQTLCLLPPGLYQNLFTACLGFPPDGFFSTDYFSLLPWGFLFLTGYFLSRLTPEDGAESLPPPRVLTVLGRHSLALYLLHQPVIYGVLTLLCGGPR